MKKLLTALVIVLLPISLFSNDMIESKGTGLYPENMAGAAQGRYLARSAALVDAKVGLVEMIYGFQLRSDTSIKNGVVVEKSAIQSSTGFLFDVVVISERNNIDGSYEVTVGIHKEDVRALLETLNGE